MLFYMSASGKAAKRYARRDGRVVEGAGLENQ